MTPRTRLLIGLSLAAIGVGVVALSYLGDEERVRRVEEVLADPAAHTHGTYTLLGVPEPPLVPVTSGDGTVLQVPNDGYANATQWTLAWSAGGILYHSQHTLQVEEDTQGGEGGDGTARWTFRNETRQAGRADLAFPPVEAAWTTTGYRAFPVRAFDGGAGEPPRLWAIYGGPLKDPMQPKPSQFEGHLLARLPDGTPLPDGANIFLVEDFTAGCSSKFLPPEEKERLELEGEGEQG